MFVCIQNGIIFQVFFNILLAHFHRDVPLAYQFLLQDSEGVYLFSKSGREINSGEYLVSR